MRSIFKTALAVAIAVGIAAVANATPFYNTNAYTRDINTGQFYSFNSATTVDSLGNFYVVYEPMATHTLDLAEFDIYGTLKMFKTLPLAAPDGSAMSPYWVGIYAGSSSLPGGIYVVNTFDPGSSYQGTQVTQFDFAGNFYWSHNYYDQSHVSEVFPIGTALDPSGHLRVALNSGHTLQGGGELVMYTYGLRGTASQSGTNRNTYPVHASFGGGYWAVNGTDHTGAAWGKFDPNGGAKIIGGSLASTDNGTVSTGYTFNTRAISDGSIFVMEQIQQNDDNTTNIISEQNIIKKFSSGNSVVWTSPLQNGIVYDVAAMGGVNTTTYVVGEDSTFTHTGVEALNNSGAIVWTDTQSLVPNIGPTIVADANGFYLCVESGISTVYELRYQNSGGPPVWEHTRTGASNHQIHLSNVYDFNGQLYVSMMVSDASGYYYAEEQRWVPGVTLKSITPGAITITGGQSVQFKVSLNAPAPAGGIAIQLSTNNPNLTFSNNTQNYTLSIPAGSIYGIVVLDSFSVQNPVTVNLKGVQNGVTAGSVVTINP